MGATSKQTNFYICKRGFSRPVHVPLTAAAPVARCCSVSSRGPCGPPCPPSHDAHHHPCSASQKDGSCPLDDGSRLTGSATAAAAEHQHGVASPRRQHVTPLPLAPATLFSSFFCLQFGLPARPALLGRQARPAPDFIPTRSLASLPAPPQTMCCRPPRSRRELPRPSTLFDATLGYGVCPSKTFFAAWPLFGQPPSTHPTSAGQRERGEVHWWDMQ